ncbi:MAG: NUDIX domain-containing protein [Actinomycetes bacterium]
MSSPSSTRAARRSAGILLLRRVADAELELLLGHMGGPLWSRKHEHAWSIPKGEYDVEVEEPLAAAYREFAEELGFPCEVPAPELTPLGDVRQSGGKVLTMWAAQVGPGTARPEPDLAAFKPGTFAMQWPPRSGRLQTFPELDRVAWVRASTAPDLLVKGQLPYLDRLPAALP